MRAPREPPGGHGYVEARGVRPAVTRTSLASDYRTAPLSTWGAPATVSASYSSGVRVTLATASTSGVGGSGGRPTDGADGGE